MKKFMALAAVGAFCVAGQAYAKDAAPAQLAGVSGAVMVEQGGKMVSASSASALRAGDRVVVKSGKAQVKFADGCVVDLAAGKMVTVATKSPCASGAGVVSTSQADAAQFDTSDTLKTAGYVVAGAAVIWGIADIAKKDDSISP
jgi:hypothetical protein